MYDGKNPIAQSGNHAACPIRLAQFRDLDIIQNIGQDTVQYVG